MGQPETDRASIPRQHGERAMAGPAPRHGPGAVGEPWDDHSDLAAVWQAHRRWVAAILLAHMPRGAELEDLLQDVAAQFVARVGELRAGGALKAWLRTVAVNTARTAGRKHRVRQRGQGVLVGLALAEQPAESEGQPVADTVDGGSELEASRRALEIALGLPEAYREPLVLRAVRGMSYRQIADALELPVTTVESRLVRARRMVQHAMERGMNA
jgi:RNA polymerase sigma-70 factor (ECF subfamily)